MLRSRTVAVYGRPPAWPFNEKTFRPGPHPVSAYGRSKAAADALTWECARRGLALTSFYPGIVLGAGDDKASGQCCSSLIRRRCPSTIYHQALATYVYVGDVLTAIERALVLPHTVGQKYLLGGTVLNGRQYAELISAVSGVGLPLLRFPDWLVTTAAALLTWRANHLTHRPPPWGLANDAARALTPVFILTVLKPSASWACATPPFARPWPRPLPLTGRA